MDQIVIKYVAFCDDPAIFLNNRAINEREAEKYPGMSFVPMLAKLLKSQQIQLVTADIAMRKIIEGKWQANEVGLVAALGSKLADYLVKLGTQPLIVFSGESPLWMPEHYVNADRFARDFKYKILFEATFRNIHSQEDNNLHFYFPSYKLSDRSRYNVPFSRKKLLCIVVSNKYILGEPASNYTAKFKTFIKTIALKYFSALVPLLGERWRVKQIFHQELQSKRLDLINYFAGKRTIDLYGPGWHDLSALPAKLIGNLKANIDLIYRGKAKSKQSTIANYKFTLCLENGRYNSYITEKIIDCFVCGTIPLYLGAPDINAYIPSDCYVDLAKFESHDELYQYITEMPEKRYEELLAAAKNFLSSEEGKKYSHEHMANLIFRLITRESP